MLTTAHQALKDQFHIQFRCLPTVMVGRCSCYTYQLEEGITENRQAMMIIPDEGILELMNANNL